MPSSALVKEREKPLVLTLWNGERALNELEPVFKSMDCRMKLKVFLLALTRSARRSE